MEQNKIDLKSLSHRTLNPDEMEIPVLLSPQSMEYIMWEAAAFLGPGGRCTWALVLLRWALNCTGG